MGQVVEPFLTLAAAARSTGLKCRTLRRLVKQRRVPYYRICGIPRVRVSEILGSIDRFERVA